MEKIEGRNGYNVLNHGLVSLVEHMGSDLSVVRNARVSYDAEWRTGEDYGKDEKLLNYMIKNGHTSPFEAVQFTFEVKAPIFVFRQWHRHRTWSYNELSARYAPLQEEFYVSEPKNYGTQNSSNKQMRDVSDGVDNYTHDEWSKFIRWENEQRALMVDVFKMYYRHIEEGMPRELARGVLPVATYSHMFATVDLHNLMHFLKLRLHPHAQYEIRVYAEAILKIIEEVCPISVAAFCEKYGIKK